MKLDTIKRTVKATVAGIAAVHLSVEAAKELEAGNPDTAGMLASVATGALDKAESAVTYKTPQSHVKWA